MTKKQPLRLFEPPPLIGEVAAQLTERLLFTHIYSVK